MTRFVHDPATEHGDLTDDASFRRVLEWSPTAMVVVDGDGLIVMANGQAGRVLGYQPDELLRQPVEKLVPERYAVQHPGFRGAYLDDPHPRPMGIGRELYARRRDGSEFPVEIGLTPIRSGGGYLVLAAIVDITERKRLEERFRRVVEFAPSAMVMIDGNGRIVLVNAQTERLFAYPRSALMGQLIEILVPERFHGDHLRYRGGFFESPQARPMGVGRDLFARRADGSEFPVEIGLNPIDTEEGPMVLASIVDITERLRTQRSLESALQEKTVLLNEVHHRVKNNLQVISSLLDLQASHTRDQNTRTLLSESKSRVRAIALTHQLLFERKEYSRIDLREFLDRLAQLLQSSYRDSSAAVVVRRVMPPQPCYLDFDRVIPCALVVNELVTNAFKHAFTHRAQGEIRIELRRHGRDLELVVCDDGAGLPVDFSLADVQSLGLQLVPLLAEQLGGSFSVAPGGMARFSLRFPEDRANEGVP